MSNQAETLNRVFENLNKMFENYTASSYTPQPGKLSQSVTIFASGELQAARWMEAYLDLYNQWKATQPTGV